MKCVMCRAVVPCFYVSGIMNSSPVRLKKASNGTIEVGSSGGEFALSGWRHRLQTTLSENNLPEYGFLCKKNTCVFHQQKCLGSQVSEDGTGYRLHGFYWFVYEASPKRPKSQSSQRTPTRIVGRNPVLSGLQRPDW